MARIRIGTVLGLMVMVGLGVRTSAPRASPWSEASFEGSVRAHVVTTWEADQGLADVEAFTRGAFDTTASSFGKGLWLRFAFPVPPGGHTIDLTLDLSRHGDRTIWPAAASDVIGGQLVERDASGAVLFQGVPSDGELTLERIVVGATIAGFRISGLVRWADDATGGWRDVELIVESDPPPEAVSPADPESPPLPLRATCRGEACYADPTYDVVHDDADPGACGGEGSVVWEAAEEEDDSGGCESSDDGDDESYPSEGACDGSDDGTTEETYPSEGACEGSDDTDDETYPQEACGGDDDDDWDDESWDDDSGGCGSGDDELQRQRDRPPVILTERRAPPLRRTLAGWIPLLALAGLGLLLDRR